MDKAEEKKTIDTSKANVLRDAMTNRKNNDLDSKVSLMSKVHNLLSKKLGPASDAAREQARKDGNPNGGFVIITKLAGTVAPEGAKKVLEKEKTEAHTPFMKRCLTAITGKEECCSDGDEKCSSKVTQALEAIKKRKKPKEHEF